MQRVKGAVFFQLASSAPPAEQLKFQDCSAHWLSFICIFPLSESKRLVCMHARLTCQISGAALHGLLLYAVERSAGEAFGITPCSLCVCARAIFAQVVSYTRCQLLQSRRNLLLSLSSGKCRQAGCLPSFRNAHFFAFSVPN